MYKFIGNYQTISLPFEEHIQLGLTALLNIKCQCTATWPAFFNKKHQSGLG